MNARFTEIYDTSDLEILFEKSFNEPIVIFKHSLTCPISSSVYREISQADAEISLIIVQHARSLSNAVAEKTGIRHESPQAIVLKDGKAIYHASHFSIGAENISEKLKVKSEK